MFWREKKCKKQRFVHSHTPKLNKTQTLTLAHSLYNTYSESHCESLHSNKTHKIIKKKIYKKNVWKQRSECTVYAICEYTFWRDMYVYAVCHCQFHWLLLLLFSTIFFVFTVRFVLFNFCILRRTCKVEKYRLHMRALAHKSSTQQAYIW